MKRIIRYSSLLPAIFIISISLVSCAQKQSGSTVIVEHWEIDNLEEIGGHPVKVSGNPEVVKSEMGNVVKFDGDGDQILVDFNPIREAKKFTVEVVFKPNPSYPENIAPRFIHMQDPDDELEKRVMIELRITEDNMCYLDGFIRSDTSSLALIDETKLHPTDQWNHAAITFDEGILTTYMNGEKQLSGQIGYAESFINPVGKVAIGGRMNQVSWFNGYIKTLKVTHAVIDPEDFIQLPK